MRLYDSCMSYKVFVRLIIGMQTANSAATAYYVVPSSYPQNEHTIL
jgi:hypothetical protein